MALSAHELILVLRGQNQLSGSLRRASSDLGRLRTQSQLMTQRGRLQAVGNTVRLQRQLAQEELRSVTTGARAKALATAKAAQAQAEFSAQQRLRRLSEQRLGIESNLLNTQARANMLARRVESGRPMRGFNVAETRQMFQAATTRIEQLRAQRATLNRELEQMDQVMARNALGAQQLIEREAGLAARAQYLRQRISALDDSIDSNTAALERNAAAIRMQPYERLQLGARYAEHLGRSFQMVGLFATAGLGYAAKQFADFSGQVTLAATQSTTAANNTTRGVLQNAAVLQRAVENLGARGQLVAPIQENVQAIYDIFSGLTLRGNQREQLDEGVKILQQFNRVLTANYGQVTMDDVARMGITLINQFNLSVDQLPATLNRMQAAVRFGRINMTEFTQSLNQVVPAFKAAGYSTDQMAASIAFMSRVFPSVRMGTTGLARLTEILSNQKTIDGIQRLLNINIAPRNRQGVRQLLPLDQIVQQIIRARPQLAKGGVDLTNFFKSVSGQTGTIQARRAFTFYATRLGLYQTIARQVIGDNNELSKSWRDMSQTPQVRWAEFTNQLRILVMQIGAGAIPVFQALAGPVQRVVRWFNALSPSTRKLVGEIAVITSVAALFGGTLISVAGGLISLYAGFKIGRIAKVAEEALVAKSAFAGVAGEAGAVSLAAARGLGFAALIALMIKFHSQTGQVIGALGGVVSIMKVLTVSFTIFGAIRIASMFADMVAAAAPAILQIGRVRTAIELLRISAAKPILITIAIAAIYEGIKHRRSINDFIRDHTSFFGRAVAASQDFFNRHVPLVRRINEATGGNPNTEEYNREQRRKRLREHRQDIASMQRVDRARADVARRNFQPFTLEQAQHGRDITQRVMRVGALNSRSVQDWIRRINAARKARLADPTDLNKARTYERLLDQLNKRYKDQPALLAAINDVLGEYNSQQKDAIKNTSDWRNTLQNTLSNVQSMYDNFLQQNQNNFGQLFQGPFIQSPRVQNRLQFGGLLTGTDLLRDIRSQVARFRKFNTELAGLSRSGAPTELINQLRQMGPDAVMQMDAFGRPRSSLIQQIRNLPKQQLQEYYRSFKAGQDVIHRQTMTDLRNKLDDYRKYGRQVGLNIVAGLRDERVGLQNELRSIILQMFPGIKPGQLTKPQANPKGEVHNYTHYHVTAPKRDQASVKAQIRHAEFARKNRYNHR